MIGLYHFSERGEMSLGITIGTNSKYFGNAFVLEGTLDINVLEEAKIRKLVHEIFINSN